MNASDSKAYTIQGFDSISAKVTSPLQLSPFGDKAVFLDFDGGRLSSGGGLVLLGDPDEQLGLTRHLAAVLREVLPELLAKVRRSSCGNGLYKYDSQKFPTGCDSNGDVHYRHTVVSATLVQRHPKEETNSRTEESKHDRTTTP